MLEIKKSIYHIAFWFFYVSVKFIDFLEHFTIYQAFVFLALPLFCNSIASYTHTWFIVHFLNSKKKSTKYAIGTILLLVTIVTMRLYAEDQIYFGIFGRVYYSHYSTGRILSSIWETSLFMLIIAMINFTFETFTLREERSKMIVEKSDFELKFLKSQINPHFLFNTFQNLNYLIQSDPTRASGLVIKLSNYLRFHFYEVTKGKVPIQTEIEFIRDYIAMEEMRLGGRVVIRSDIDMSDDKYQIMPLILISFIENAFKHGTPMTGEGKILIKLRNKGHGALLFVANHKTNSNPVSSMSGLESVQKILRYEYPRLHNLKIRNGLDYFAVVLEITLE